MSKRKCTSQKRKYIFFHLKKFPLIASNHLLTYFTYKINGGTSFAAIGNLLKLLQVGQYSMLNAILN